MKTVLLAAVLWIVPPPPSPAPPVTQAGCPGHERKSCYEPWTGRIYWRADQGPGMLEHERGHAYDHQELTPGERATLQRTFDWARWHPERFADFYAGCRLRSLRDVMRPHWYGRWRDPQRIAARCRMIARAGR